MASINEFQRQNVVNPDFSYVAFRMDDAKVRLEKYAGMLRVFLATDPKALELRALGAKMTIRTEKSSSGGGENARFVKDLFLEVQRLSSLFYLIDCWVIFFVIDLILFLCLRVRNGICRCGTTFLGRYCHNCGQDGGVPNHIPLQGRGEGGGEAAIVQDIWSKEQTPH